MSSIYQRKDGNWVYQYYVNGKRTRIYLGAFANKALVKYKKAELDILYGKKKNVPAEKTPVHKILHDYFNILALRCSNKAHIHNTKTRIKRFIDQTNIHYINQTTRQKIETFLHQRKLNGKSDLTIKNELIAIKGLINFCVDNHYLITNPAKDIKVAREQKRPPVFFTEQQISELLEKIDNYPMRYMVYISLSTGVRPNELQAMEWQDWDFDRNILTIPKSKSRYWRTIPFNNALSNKIKEIARNKGKCFDYATIPPRKQVLKLRKELSFDFNYYDLRHTYACQLLLNGMDIKTVQQLMGHREIKTTMIYLEALGMYKYDEVKNINLLKTATKTTTNKIAQSV